MKYWETQDGERIAVKKMTTSHLENCIRFLEKKFVNGKVIVIEEYGGMGIDNMDIWYDTEEVDITNEIKDWIKTFKKELKKRK